MSSGHVLRDHLLRLSRHELSLRLRAGRTVEPSALEGFLYRGTALGLPRVVERLTWRTFQKAFWRHPESGRVLGWNVRLHQDGLDAPSRAQTTRGGAPVTTWYYELLRAEDAALPPAWPRALRHGLVIDYARAKNPMLDAVHLVKDPLVDVGDGCGEHLLGVSYLVVPGMCVPTPTFFLLEREAPISFVPPCLVEKGGARWVTLLPSERRVAEHIFDAILAIDEHGEPGEHGALPAFARLDHAGFWRALEAGTAPHVAAGLRATIHALNAAPLVLAGVHRPLTALSRAERIACLARLATSERYEVRQMIATAKILACFAYFEHDDVRRALGGNATMQDTERSCAA